MKNDNEFYIKEIYSLLILILVTLPVLLLAGFVFIVNIIFILLGLVVYTLLVLVAFVEFLLYKSFCLVWDVIFGYWASNVFGKNLMFGGFSYINLTTPKRPLKTLDGGIWEYIKDWVYNGTLFGIFLHDEHSIDET